MEEQSTTLYFKQGSSDKEYQVMLLRDTEFGKDGWVVNFAYGRRGSPLKHGTRTVMPILYDAAFKKYSNLIASKKAKGYTTATSGTAFVGTETAGERTNWLPQLLNEVVDSDLLGIYRNWRRHMWVQTKHDGERRGILIRGDQIIGANRKGLTVPLNDDIYRSLRIIAGNAEDCKITLDCEDMGGHLVIFDVLDWGVDLREETFEKRSNALSRLAMLIAQHNLESYLHIDVPIRPVDFQELRAIIQVNRVANEEGVVLRYGLAPYDIGKPNSGGNCLKLKFWESATCIVESVHPTKRSIGIGMYPQGTNLVGNCTVPTNYDIPEVGDLVEIKYLYAYRGGSLYQPQYKGERTDLNREAASATQLKYRI